MERYILHPGSRGWTVVFQRFGPYRHVDHSVDRLPDLFCRKKQVEEAEP